MSFPAFARAYADVARTVAFAPVRALAEAHPRLLAKREAFADELKAFREMSLAAQRALASSASDEDAGLAWRPGSGARDGGLPVGGPAWTAWADSLFEHVVRRADETMEGLRDAARALDRVASETRGAFLEKETFFSGETEPAFGLAPAASRMSACADAHEKRVAEALRACASAASVIAEDAKRDLPLLAANREKTAADLRREALGAAAAIATWSAAAESRRRRKTKAALDAMRDAADAAAAAFEAGTAEDAAAAAAVTPPPPPPPRVSSRQKTPSEEDGETSRRDRHASLAASFALEDAQLESASVSLAAAARTVSRRKNAVARERAAAEAVRSHAASAALHAKRRAARLERVASACETSLLARADPLTLRERLPSLEASVSALGRASAGLVRDLVTRDHLPWLEASADAAALTYVSVLDAAAQRLDAFADVCAARVAERAARERLSFSFRGAEGRTILGGLLEDAAELIAPASRDAGNAAKEAEAARGDGDAAERRRESSSEREKRRDEETVFEGKKTPATATATASDAGGVSPANQFPLLRDRGAKAFSSLAFGVENGMAKLSGAFQGSAVGGALAKTFGGKKEREKEKDVETSEGFSPSSPSAVTAASVTQSPSPTEGPASAASASASASRESRALREARDDLRRLETRRDELLEKKKQLRAFLLPARENASARRRDDGT